MDLYAEQIPALLGTSGEPFSLAQTPKKLEAAGTELVGFNVGLFDGVLLGEIVGIFEGDLVGALVGFNDGIFEGAFVGNLEDALVGNWEGVLVAFSFSAEAGIVIGLTDGLIELSVGFIDGLIELTTLGFIDGLIELTTLGFIEGLFVGFPLFEVGSKDGFDAGMLVGGTGGINLFVKSFLNIPKSTQLFYESQL